MISPAARRAAQCLLSSSKTKKRTTSSARCFFNTTQEIAPLLRRNYSISYRCWAPPQTQLKYASPVVTSIRHKSSSSACSHNDNGGSLERQRHKILTHALQRVHDEGWTDDAVASGTLDAGLPPTYIGHVISSTSVFGSADLVAFFMDECNKNLLRELSILASEKVDDTSDDDVAVKIYKALQYRLSLTLPFVSSNRWHEGIAIGALPQNAYRTAQQLDEMATHVLDYALGKSRANAAQRAIIVAAYAAAELHLLSDGSNGGSVASISLSGERYKSTWSFLEERSNEAAVLIVDGVDGTSFSRVPLPNPTHLMAASAVVSSLAGAALSIAAPSAAAILPRALEALGPLHNAINSSVASSTKGTQPSDYQPIDTNTLPPFDTNEMIFPVKNPE